MRFVWSLGRQGRSISDAAASLAIPAWGLSRRSRAAKTQGQEALRTAGETRDFEFRPAEPGDYRFEVRNREGKLRILMPVQVR